MANFRAPGIKFTESDISEVVTPSGTSVGALVGPAYKGPTNQRVLVTSTNDFYSTFGTPISGSANEFTYYAADAFLRESSFMYFVRTTTAADKVGASEYTGTTGAIDVTVATNAARNALVDIATADETVATIVLRDALYDGTDPTKDGKTVFVTADSTLYTYVYSGDNYTVTPSVADTNIVLVSSNNQTYTYATGTPGTYTATTLPAIVPQLISEGITANVLNQAGYEDGSKPDKYYALETGSTASAGVTIGARSCGPESKNIGISLITGASTSTTAVGYDYGYNWAGKFPDTSNYYRINVYNKLDKTSDTEAGWVSGHAAIKAVIPSETYIVSNDELAKDFDGNSMYVRDVINGRSPTIYVVPGTDTTFLNGDWSLQGINSLVEGETSLSLSSVSSGWDLLADREKSSPDILIAPYDSDSSNGDAVTALSKAATIAATRKDCMAVVNVGSKDDTPEQIVTLKGNVSQYNSSFVACYAGWDKIFDQFSSKTLYVPKAAFAAAIFARNDNIAKVWNAPAGLTRGGMGTLDQYRVYTEAELGFMYNTNINTSRRIRGAGDILWGQKTGQTKASALDRINVRRLLNFIEKTIEPTLLGYIFEQNTGRLRSRVQSNLDSFLDTIVAGGGLSAYQVVVDESNNTPQVIDNNELAIDIFVQPTKTIEFINVQIIITKTGASFAVV